MIENLVMLWHNNKTHIVDLFTLKQVKKNIRKCSYALCLFFVNYPWGTLVETKEKACMKLILLIEALLIYTESVFHLNCRAKSTPPLFCVV